MSSVTCSSKSTVDTGMLFSDRVTRRRNCFRLLYTKSFTGSRKPVPHSIQFTTRIVAMVLQVYRQRLALIISLRTGIIELMVGITKHSLVGKDVVQLVVERKDILRRIYCIQVCRILKGSYNHSTLLHRSR